MSQYQSKLYPAVLEELRRALADNKVTQVEVGEALGIKQSAVSSLLSGKSKMTVEQFLVVSDLVGIRPNKMLSAAETVLSKTLPMPYELESVLYSSEIHLLAYCAASQEISADDLVNAEVPKEKAKKVLDELVSVGALSFKKGRYIQKDPTVTYQASSRRRQIECHQKLVLRAWQLWEKYRENPQFRLRRFNLWQLDRFTLGQIKEMEAILWRVYERMQAFQRENAAAGYSSEEPMPLWSIHLMMTTPLENK